MKGLGVLISAVLAATLLGCENAANTTTQDDIDETGFFAKFDPSASVIPFPNNVLFSGSSDATLNIPTAGLSGGELATVTALNSMDGFSSASAMSTTFSKSIDATTLLAGSTVRVFEVTLSGIGGAVTDVVAELPATEFVASVSTVDGSDPNNPDPGANKLVIIPLKPFKPSTSYAVVLTSGIKDSDGNNAVSDLIYAFTKSTSTLTTTSPADATSLTEVKYSALLSTADANQDGAIDAGEEAAALASVNSLEGLRQLTNFTEAAVSTDTDITSPPATSDIILSWVFTTQSQAISPNTNHPLQRALAAVVGNPTANVNPTATMTSAAYGGADYADIHVGTINVPYYLTNNDAPANLDPATNYWRNSGGGHLTPLDPAPINNGAETIPLLVSIPNNNSPGWGTGKPVAGWPVVIFQHGITANRTSMLAIADALAARGFAAVAIDLPLHGIPTADDTLGIRSATAAFDSNVSERTFDLDYVNNTTGLPGADGKTDGSGANYVNLSSLMTLRDNVYQSVADLFTLTQSLNASGAGTGMSVDGDADGDFDPLRIYFIGHSLGGIIGSTFLAIETNVQDAVLAMPGGGLPKVLDGSAAFGPVIEAGLAANGVNKGTAEYESFMASAQMMLDGADPINYASTLGASSQGILMFEVVGDGGSNLSDLVVPNTVPDANDTANTIASPLAGTEPLITQMGLTQFDASDVTTNLHAVVKFTAGHHSSLLKSTDANDQVDALSADVFDEMQHEAAQFLLNNGALDIGGIADPTTVVQAVP